MSSEYLKGKLVFKRDVQMNVSNLGIKALKLMAQTRIQINPKTDIKNVTILESKTHTMLIESLLNATTDFICLVCMSGFPLCNILFLILFD